MSDILVTNTQHYRIYYEDTDAGGVVYHSNYLNFAERARTDWLREKNITLSTLAQEEGILFVVKNISMELHKPAKLDDIVTVQTTLEKLSGTRLFLLQKLFCGDTLLADITTTIASVNRIPKPVRIPKHIVTAISN